MKISYKFVAVLCHSNNTFSCFNAGFLTFSYMATLKLHNIINFFEGTVRNLNTSLSLADQKINS